MNDNVQTSQMLGLPSLPQSVKLFLIIFGNDYSAETKHGEAFIDLPSDMTSALIEKQVILGNVGAFRPNDRLVTLSRFNPALSQVLKFLFNDMGFA
ncbi:hypothetical protein BH24CHL3_BH24CHL3_03630 [soil metagenome]